MNLFEIKQDLEKFQLVQCGLYHEKVAFNGETKMPISKGIGNQQEFKRVNLCDLSDRRKRLGCAHSMSNANFNQLIKDLALKDKSIGLLNLKFNVVVNSIYQLDHRAGYLEKDHATSLTPNNSHPISTSEIEKELLEVKAIHFGYISQLEGIKSDIILRINEMLQVK
ncbi:MAG: hypothetical protein JKY54_15615 [Flavobacteriales bacterium]|nr:hypothetical protein [Flavobacteriales bacterium]